MIDDVNCCDCKVFEKKQLEIDSINERKIFKSIN